MEIRLLKREYMRSDKLYIDFLMNRIVEKEENFTQKSILIKNDRDFPICFTSSVVKREEAFLKAFKNISLVIEDMNREDYLNEDFWFSYLLTKKREYILEEYPSIRNSIKDFKSIVLRRFDWGNYIYKIVFIVEYIKEYAKDEEEENRYYKLILNNLDLFNYILKYSIFRNGEFLIKILKVVEENNLSNLCKKKIKYYAPKDKRYGREVVAELNRLYPIVLSPLMSKKDLKALFLNILENLLDLDGFSLDDIKKIK